MAGTVYIGVPPAPPAAEDRTPQTPPIFPPIWNVPPRNALFTGREALLNDLHAALTSGEPAALTQAIAGLGGVGKTQLAVEYAYRHANDFDLVWWLRAEAPALLAADYAELAYELEMVPRGEPVRDQSALIAAVIRRLQEGRERWLLVFDNAPDPASLRGLIPQGPARRVLITSRHPEWGTLAQPLRVPVFEPEEALQYLLERTGEEDADAAEELAEELGRLPLALAQAAAYIAETKTTLRGYLALFRERREALWARERPPDDYPATVGTTWSVAMERAEAENPVAADLLRLCAYLAPEGIPLALLREGRKQVPEPLREALGDELALSAALRPLLGLSLADRAGDTLTVHRLVGAVTRDRLPEEGRTRWATAAVELVDAACPGGNIYDDPDVWPTCDALLPQALAATAHAESLAVAPIATQHVLTVLGVYQQTRAQFREARRLFERAIPIAQATYGDEHPEVATVISNLGSVLRHLGELAEARRCFERVLEILNPDHPNYAGALNNMGLVLLDLGQVAEAGRRFERALPIFEKAIGENHPTIATLVKDLGLVLQGLSEMGDMETRSSPVEPGPRVNEAACGPERRAGARGVNNLRGVLWELGELAAARRCLERALAIDEAAYGPDHPEVATDVWNLGMLLAELGETEKARCCLERALRIWEAKLGPEHPNTQTARRNLEGLG
ncbi:MAG: tetratricopeptide repeat protein [Chloroflexi bacterium]|nr:tetratricopeptide repeat protein [Chloroflexota bacterium]